VIRLTEPQAKKSSTAGETLALVVGVALLAAAAYVGLVVGEPAGAAILALIAAGALSGWVKARRR
jgi:hypothetical protein